MIRNKILVLLSLLLVTTNINAQNNVWTDSKQINAVQVMSNGGFIMILDSDQSTVCQKNDRNIIGVSQNQNEVTIAGAKSLLSTALIAFTTDKKVKIQYSYSIESDYCWGKSLYLSN